MGAKRGVVPATVIAALIALGFALYRPNLVPELKPGTRAPHTPPALAATIAWPSTPSTVPPAATPRFAHAATADGAPTEEALGAWRDALADRPFSGWESAGAAARAAPSARRTEPKPARASAPVSRSRSLHEAVVGLLRAAERRAKKLSGLRPPSPAGPGSAESPRRRVPLALGPAEPEPGEKSRAAVPASATVRPDSKPVGGGSLLSRRARYFPLFRPPKRDLESRADAAERRRGAAARRRVRPPRLSTLLGPGALRPPPSSLIPPDLSKLDEQKPPRLPDGAPTPERALELERVEAHDPVLGASADRRRAPHWDSGPRWHASSAHGVVSDARWLWFWKEKTRWWAVVAEEKTPLLRHGDLWWGKRRGVWFALHGGELWSWRRFADWDAEGLLRLTDGVELVYSSDFTKVAVITPGAGAVLYDARTGAELGEWLESELPRRRPRAPAGLRLPRGI